MHDRVPVPAQSRLVGGRAEVSWIIPELDKGASMRYTLSFEKNSRPVPASGVIIDKNGGNLDIRINNELFATYNTTTGPNKPYFYPMFAPGHKRIVRGYPIEVTAADVSKDHPHHRGLWFSYDDVKRWGGTVTPMEHTAKSAKERYDAGMLDACFGDGSAYDGTCWKWMAERGYRFLDITEAAMQKLEAQGKLEAALQALLPLLPKGAVPPRFRGA